MSRQFSFYLLPSDIERLSTELRGKFGAKFFDSDSPSMTPVELSTLVRKSESGVTSVNCYIVPPQDSDIKTKFSEARNLWFVDLSSEVIEFSGCHFDGKVLLRGRFYFQTDMIVGNELWRKRPEFLDWADKVFRTTKQLLHRSKRMDAYVGEDALRWRQKGGRFAALRKADGTPLYEPDE